MHTQPFLESPPSKSDQARRRLLEAAVLIFGEKGPDGATVREIAQAAGQNLAAITYYFGGKEGLYRTVIEGLVRDLRQRLEAVFEQIDRLRQAPERSPSEATRLLQLFLRTIYLRLLSRTEAVPIAQLLVREQLRPTTHFKILYEQGFRPLHESLSFLVGTALGRNPRDREIILRTHLLMGQVYFFAMTREGILRRLAWKDLEGKKAELVAEILDEHIEILLSGLRERTKPTRHSP